MVIVRGKFAIVMQFVARVSFRQSTAKETRTRASERITDHISIDGGGGEGEEAYERVSLRIRSASIGLAIAQRVALRKLRHSVRLRGSAGRLGHF